MKTNMTQIGFLIFAIISFQLNGQEIQFELQAVDSLDNKEIRGLFQDTQNQIWLSTKGKGIYKSKEGQIQKLKSNDQNVLNSFICALEVQGEIWFGARGVMKLDNQNTQLLSEKLPVKSTVVFSITNHGEQIYFSGNRGVAMYDGKTWNHYDQTNGLKHQVVHDTKVDAAGNTWFATRKGGLNMLNKEGEWHYFLPTHNCRKLLLTSEKEMWIGTSTGTILMDTSARTSQEFSKGAALIPQFQTKEGTVFFTTEGKGVFIYDGTAWKNYNAQNSPLKSNVVHSAILVDENEIWLGFDKGFQVLEKQKL